MSEEQIEDAATAPEATNDDWRGALPEDIRENATLAKYNDVSALASAHINLQSHLGRDKITKPVTEDDWNNVYEFLGRPESADKYETNVPEEMQPLLSEDSVGSLKEKAHSLGLTQAQLSGLMEWWSGDIGGQMKAQTDQMETQRAEAEATLQQEWGKAYDKNVALVQKTFEEYSTPEVADKINKAGLGNDPDVLKLFYNVATATLSETDLKGPTNQQGEALTPQEAKDRASEIMANPAYTNKGHPEHAKLVRQVTQLFEKAYG